MYSNIAKWKFWHVAKTKFDHFCQIYKHFIAKNKNENLHRNWWAESRDGYIDFHGRNLNRNWTMSISDYWNHHQSQFWAANLHQQIGFCSLSEQNGAFWCAWSYEIQSLIIHRPIMIFQSCWKFFYSSNILLFLAGILHSVVIVACSLLYSHSLRRLSSKIDGIPYAVERHIGNFLSSWPEIRASMAAHAHRIKLETFLNWRQRYQIRNK